MRVAIVGAGSIGASWAALFGAYGHQVVACDPEPDTLAGLVAAVGPYWESLDRLGLIAPGADPEAIELAPTTQAAVTGADFVQENGPERLDIKHEIFAAIDTVADPGVVIASSSSGIMASDIQAGCIRHPERIVIGHPFNPPHLVPLVEVVGGQATDEESIAAAMAVYRSIGRTPIHIRAELPGHVTNRLQAALWREAYWLVEQGVVSVDEVDSAIANGPGLRWSLLGPFATQHLSGGPGGLRHVLEHLGPPMVDWWQTLEAPCWGEELIETLVAGMDESLAGRDTAEMRVARDRLLEQLLSAKAAEPTPTPDTETDTDTVTTKPEQP